MSAAPPVFKNQRIFATFISKSIIKSIMCTCCSQQNACPTHKDQTFKYLCISKTCFQPLCQKCSQEHQQKHSPVNPMELIPFEQAQRQAASKIQKYQAKLQGLSSEREKLATQNRRKLQHLKMSMIKQVQMAFNPKDLIRSRLNAINNGQGLKSILLYEEGLWGGLPVRRQSALNSKIYKERIRSFLEDNIKLVT